MISVQEAVSRLSKYPIQIGCEKVALHESLGRRLREPIVADRDFPPYHRVSMDGIAIRFPDFERGLREFPIAGIQPAGAPQIENHEPGTAIEIMTGASIPDGLDTVIRYEDLLVKDGTARVLIEDVKASQNVHAKGYDRKAGDVLVESNSLITPAEIGVAATVGMSQVLVAAMPQTIVVSTGDELVPVEAEPLPHQIRSSNSIMIQSALQAIGVRADIGHLQDDRISMKKQIKTWMDQYQVMIILGGSSKGKYDFVPDVLSELQVQEHFYKVRQRPGKPFWFGSRETNFFAFALPGNPVSCFLCYKKYFTFWLNNSLGITKNATEATLASDFSFQPELTYFLQVQLEFSPGGIKAHPVVGHGSGDLANLTLADGFMELPATSSKFGVGETYPIIPYRYTFN